MSFTSPKPRTNGDAHSGGSTDRTANSLSGAASVRTWCDSNPLGILSAWPGSASSLFFTHNSEISFPFTPSHMSPSVKKSPHVQGKTSASRPSTRLA